MLPGPFMVAEIEEWCVGAESEERVVGASDDGELRQSGRASSAASRWSREKEAAADNYPATKPRCPRRIVVARGSGAVWGMA